jgi:riboflavin synthase
MFTGIIETLGIIQDIQDEGGNLRLSVTSSITSLLKIDQSIAHNGICLTIVAIQDNVYTVTAIQETIEKTTIGSWKIGDLLNLERAMKLDARLDGHLVQGHVDQIGHCTTIIESDGSWYYTFTFDSSYSNITIEKGSITVNGVSLTVVNSKQNEFSVAIIPYTYEHTNFKSFKIGSKINLEFDMIGKYVARLHELNR